MNQALSSVEKLNRQRQAAAIARSHAHMLQLKVVVVCGCAIASAFGVALYRAGPAKSGTSSTTVPAVETPGIHQGAASRRIGQIQVPHEGETCLHYRFDNKTGVVGDETEVECTPVNIVPALSEVSRTEAMMRAFRFNR
jgi:hypothetical protein